MRQKKAVTAGIDIGGTKCAVSLAYLKEGEAELLEKTRIETGREGPAPVLEQLVTCLRALLEAHPDWELEAVGISCGGPLDEERGLILGPPNLPGWDEVDVTGPFEDAFGVPVGLRNDANACALAEWRYGAGRGTKNMIFLTFGTGLGAGLILDGRLYSGSNGNAGEVGHIRLSREGPVGYGKAGSFEGFCSGGGIAQLGRSMAGPGREGEMVTARDLALAAGRGDEAALAVFRRSAARLGQGLAILIDILNPEVIVIGSIFARQESLFREEMERVLEEEALPFSRQVCRILPAMLGEEIGDYAALAVGREVWEEKNGLYC